MNKQEAYERLVAIARNIGGEGGSLEQLVHELGKAADVKKPDEESVRAIREGKK